MSIFYGLENVFIKSVVPNLYNKLFYYKKYVEF